MMTETLWNILIFILTLSGMDTTDLDRIAAEPAPAVGEIGPVTTIEPTEPPDAYRVVVEAGHRLTQRYVDEGNHGWWETVSVDSMGPFEVRCDTLEAGGLSAPSALALLNSPTDGTCRLV